LIDSFVQLEKTCAFTSATSHLKIKARKLQVKSGVASWELLYCEYWFSLTTTNVNIFLWFYL